MSEIHQVPLPRLATNSSETLELRIHFDTNGVLGGIIAGGSIAGNVITACWKQS
jgi:hypothetical protein